MVLWDWALDVYGRPGVEAAALALQDAHGQNVPFLLWAAWARSTESARLLQGADVARRWEAVAVGPLRGVRRDLKHAVEGIGTPARLALRGQVRGLELEAERALLSALEAIAGEADAAPPPLEDALRAAVGAWGGSPPAQALQAFARAIG